MSLVVIIGSSGYVGSMLHEHFGSGHDVVGVSRRATPRTEVVMDMSSDDPWDALPAKADLVINAAAIKGIKPEVPSEEYFRINALLPQQAAKYAHGAGAHLIQLSTSGVYGYRKKACTEKHKPVLGDIYNLSKYHGEASASFAVRGLPVAVLRLCFPYGPGQIGSLFSLLCQNLLKGRPTRLNNPEGRPEITPIYISDLCRQIEAVHKKRLAGIFNCGGQEKVSVKALAQTIGRITAKKPRFEVGNADLSNLIVDSRKLWKACGVEPKVKVRDGMDKTLTALLGEANS